MKKYINCENFIQWLENLKLNNYYSLYVEKDDSEPMEYLFLRVVFDGSDVIIHSCAYGGLGTIFDTPIAPWQDYAECLFNDLEDEGRYKLFIKQDND